jgi:hypothetical protein
MRRKEGKDLKLQQIHEMNDCNFKCEQHLEFVSFYLRQAHRDAALSPHVSHF